MFKLLKFVFSLFLLLFLLAYYFKIPIENKIPQEIQTQISQFEKTKVWPVVKKIGDAVSAPEPLRLAKDASTASQDKTALTASGVIVLTNAERTKQGLEKLKTNSVLGSVAKKKLDDLFARQYFAHVSPTGKDVSNLAHDAGYEYIVIGENLALGNFKDDAALVLAWMNSPGHRANILNKRYTEIGVAVGRGVYEGSETWIGVQSFGLPISACPIPDASLKASLEKAEAQVDILKTTLDTKKAELEATDNSDPSYSDKATIYNNLISVYNSLVRQVQEGIATYNQQISVSNHCREGV